MRLAKIHPLARLALLVLMAVLLVAGDSVALVCGSVAAAAASQPGGTVQPGANLQPAIGVAGRDFPPGQLIVRFAGRRERLVVLPAGISVEEAAAALSRNTRVAYAEPNYTAHADALTPEGWVPNDPGAGKTPAGWQALQWNFLPCGSYCGAPNQTGAQLLYQARGGIDAPRAWEILRDRGRPGAAGVRIAVLDTGIAYRSLRHGHTKSPDFSPRQFGAGYDFVDRTRLPLDRNGHGTHIAGTIGERTDNGRALTGLAYEAKMIPVRVLNADGTGHSRQIARGIRFATQHGARVINLSFEFGGLIKSCTQIRSVCSAVRYASDRGAVIVAAAGNAGTPSVSFPAQIPNVIGVGANTEGGCVAGYSDRGAGLALVAPGGSGEAGTPCHTPDRPIFPETLIHPGAHTFGFPSDYIGSSMSAAHVSGVAAMVIASGVLGAQPSPARIACQIESTARTTDLGEPYQASTFGAGLLDAGRAVSLPAPAC